MPDQELVAQGWEKRFVGDERMIQESVSTYEALGYEVKLLPLSESSLREECQGCFLTLSTFRILYTRKKALV